MTLVLCYHALSASWPDALAVEPSAFARHLRSLLARRFRPIPAGEVLAGRRRTFHVTFDDAFRSVSQAVPILERLGAHATVFACTDLADTGARLTVPEVETRSAGYPQEVETMDWHALRELAERGVEIGSHTASHPHVRLLTDAELDRELRQSRERLEDELGRRCRYLAFPYGETDERVELAAERAGYDAAFALNIAIHEDSQRLYALPRVGVYRKDTVVRFTLKTSFLRWPLARLRALPDEPRNASDPR